MALIVCSECGKEFSDKALTCPNCGCPTEVMINNDEKGIYVDNKDSKIYCPECNQEISSDVDTCPECGYPFKATETLSFQTEQEVKMVDIPRKKALTFSCILYALAALCFVNVYMRFKSDWFRMYKIRWMEYSDSDYKSQFFIYTGVSILLCIVGIALICVGISLQRGSKPKSKAPKNIMPVTSSLSSIPYYPSSTSNSGSTSEVRCPKCGSTQIQMVPRKWSPLTGFMTNKVDRVCMKCKHRF